MPSPRVLRQPSRFASLVIQGYAVNAMRGEPGYRRFFCGSSVLALCTTGFVLSPNLFELV